MGKVQKLPESLIRLIAAGEVIERPASVVKELVENSLDAGATKVDIDLWSAGRQRIRVSDDGEGMTQEDALLALDRHATSKLQTFDDLQALDTFGFRGEALPSIAAISRLELTTRTRNEPQGWSLKLEAGKLLSTSAVGITQGTTIDVQDLFFNTPARSKFLKRDSTERTHILRTLQELALVHSDVSFIVHLDGKTILDLPGSSTLSGRLGDLWSLTVLEQLVPLNVKQGPCTISGFVNSIPGHHPTKAYQNLFVNRRPVQQRMLTRAIYEAYHEWLPVGRHPVFALFIDIDPNLVDVNVHPTKREVRFSDERAVYDVLFSQLRALFKDRQNAPVLRTAVGSGASALGGVGGWTRETSSSVADHLQAIALQMPFATVVSDAPMPRFPDAATPQSSGAFSDRNTRVLGQFQKLYLLVEQGDELLLIDQHAAAERVLYERLLSAAHLQTPERQRLLTPYVWTVSADRAETIRSWLPALEETGFGIDPFGPASFAVKEWPAVFPELKDARQFLEKFVESLESESSTPQEGALHEKVARAACRAAIMANDVLSPDEIKGLLADLAACERPMTCPHGRPTHIRLPLAELHKKFKRT